ncbi:MAG: integrase [Sphingobacteriales bacterium]|nr:MAG: integrase [Sphingobacteriales bacterium]
MAFPDWIRQIAQPGEHRQQSVIWISFPYDPASISELKTLGASYSHSRKSWYFRDTEAIREALLLPPKFPVGKEGLLKVHPVNQQALQKMDEVLTLKRYSSNTRSTYLKEFAQLLYLVGSFPVQELSADKIRSYFLYCHKELKLSENAIHSRLNAVKFYFEQVLHREKMFIEIPRPKKPSLLPKVLNQKEISLLFKNTDNLKHRLMLQLCYGMGLRVSEIVGLRVSDIDSTRMQVLIAGAKGKKDRYVQLPATTLQALRDYYLKYRPENYLFEGQQGDRYSIRSVQAVFKNAMRKSNIKKAVGIHSLRHSYATHLHEYGVDIGFIQKLLGHNQIKTTLIYTQVSQAKASEIKSPLDRMDE